MKDSERQSLQSRAAQAIYSHSSRRGFLAKTAAAVSAFGMGEVLLNQQPASAASGIPDAPECCVGTACSSCPGTCPGTTQCPSGWTWDGYRWSCCLGSRVVFCRDCVKTGSLCVCACVTQNLCGAATGTRFTATALSAAGRQRQARPPQQGPVS